MFFNKKIYKVIEMRTVSTKENIFFNKKDFRNFVKEMKRENSYNNIEVFKDGAVAWN